MYSPWPAAVARCQFFAESMRRAANLYDLMQQRLNHSCSAQHCKSGSQLKKLGYWVMAVFDAPWQLAVQSPGPLHQME